MSRKQKQQRVADSCGQVEEKLLTIATTETPKPRRYVPPEHSECSSLRPAGTRYTTVVHTSKSNMDGKIIITRYCSCGFCRPAKDSEARRPITHKDVQIISNTSLLFLRSWKEEYSITETPTTSCDHGDISIVVSAD